VCKIFGGEQLPFSPSFAEHPQECLASDVAAGKSLLLMLDRNNSFLTDTFQPLLGVADFVLHTILRLPRRFRFGSLSFNFLGLLKLHTAFLISGLVHLAGEYMMQGYLGFGAFKFFALQPWAITLEVLVRYMITGSIRVNGDGKTQELGMTWRAVGYIWVFCWFVGVGHLIQQPMVDAGTFLLEHSELTMNVGRWLALGA